jgi:hypothetical protein
MASFIVDNVEEVMVNDGTEEVEEFWDSRWSVIDVFLVVLMATLLIVTAFMNRTSILHEQRTLFLLMVLFLTYQILSYVIVFLISAVVALVLLICCKYHLAYGLNKLYRNLQSLVEISILGYSFYEGLRWLLSDRLEGKIYHQMFFLCMLLTISFKLIRIVMAFCHSGPRKQVHLAYIGGQSYRVHQSRESQQRKEVVSMMAKISDGTMVSPDQKVKVEGLELF